MVIPAIDLQGGRCVRLVEGRADTATVFGDDPVAWARRACTSSIWTAPSPGVPGTRR